MEFAKIFTFCFVTTIIYGILHDQITVRICKEYFTIGHPAIIPSFNTTLLGLGWGIIATWWVGLLLGLPLAAVCRIGNRRKLSLYMIIKQIIALFAITFIISSIFGLTGWLLADCKIINLSDPFARRIQDAKHPYFLADAWMHSASYIIGISCGVLFILYIIYIRYAYPSDESHSKQSVGSP